jgi:hypothetical protein
MKIMIQSCLWRLQQQLVAGRRQHDSGHSDHDRRGHDRHLCCYCCYLKAFISRVKLSEGGATLLTRAAGIGRSNSSHSLQTRVVICMLLASLLPIPGQYATAWLCSRGTAGTRATPAASGRGLACARDRPGAAPAARGAARRPGSVGPRRHIIRLVLHRSAKASKHVRVGCLGFPSSNARPAQNGQNEG